MPPVEAPRWSEQQLDDDRRAAIGVFRHQRMAEPLEQFIEAFDEYRGVVEDLLELTVNLSELGEHALEIASDKPLLLALRYLAGPPISADDLKVLSDVESMARSRIQANPAWAKQIVETVLLGLDRRRFAWVPEDRDPDETERDAAAIATAALMASQRAQTARRSEARSGQEQAVENHLIAGGFEKVPTRGITNLGQAPEAGTFCRESMFGSRKADFAVGVWDGRKMALECKVSSSELNSIKRINNDAAVKANVWIREFGSTGVVPAAVLAGVYKRAHLEYAQERGLTLFWAHNLDALTDWIKTTRPA